MILVAQPRMCPRRYCQCWHLHVEAWKGSVLRWQHPAQGRLLGKQRLPDMGHPKGEWGMCLHIFMKHKGLHLGFLLCGERLLHATRLPTRRKARVTCPELLWGALPHLVVSQLLRSEEQKPWGGVSGGRLETQFSAQSHKEGDDHLHHHSQGAEWKCSKPPWGWACILMVTNQPACELSISDPGPGWAGLGRAGGGGSPGYIGQESVLCLLCLPHIP